MYFQCLFLLIYRGARSRSSTVGTWAGSGGVIEDPASFVLLDFLDFFFFFFFVITEVGGDVTRDIAPSPGNGGDGGGVKIWTGFTVVEESVSEVAVMGGQVKGNEQRTDSACAALS